MWFLAEVSLQKTLKCAAMTSLVAGHLMYGVMDSIQVRSLCALSKVELTSGSAILSGNSHLQVLLGAVGNNLSQKLSKGRFPDIPLCEQLLP